MNDESPPPFLECQRTKRPAIQVLFSAVLLAGIGYLAGEGYLILLGTMSLIFIFYALMISIDDSIRLRINEEGLSGENVPQKVVRWEELSEYALVQKKSERISKTFSECKSSEGNSTDIELSRLNYSESDICKFVEYYLGTDPDAWKDVESE